MCPLYGSKVTGRQILIKFTETLGVSYPALACAKDPDRKNAQKIFLSLSALILSCAREVGSPLKAANCCTDKTYPNPLAR